MLEKHWLTRYNEYNYKTSLNFVRFAPFFITLASSEVFASPEYRWILFSADLFLSGLGGYYFDVYKRMYLDFLERNASSDEAVIDENEGRKFSSPIPHKQMHYASMNPSIAALLENEGSYANRGSFYSSDNDSESSLEDFASFSSVESKGAQGFDVNIISPEEEFCKTVFVIGIEGISHGCFMFVSLLLLDAYVLDISTPVKMITLFALIGMYIGVAFYDKRLFEGKFDYHYDGRRQFNRFSSASQTGPVLGISQSRFDSIPQTYNEVQKQKAMYYSVFYLKVLAKGVAKCASYTYTLRPMLKGESYQNIVVVLVSCLLGVALEFQASSVKRSREKMNNRRLQVNQSLERTNQLNDRADYLSDAFLAFDNAVTIAGIWQVLFLVLDSIEKGMMKDNLVWTALACFAVNFIFQLSAPNLFKRPIQQEEERVGVSYDIVADVSTLSTPLIS